MTLHKDLTGGNLHNSKIKTGSGDPNSTLTAATWVGDIYVDTATHTLYIRETNNGSSGDWLPCPIAHVGAHTITFTTSGNTSVTLPTTGTLSTLAGTENLTNKTLDNTNTITAKDTLFTLQDNSDATKQMTFELSGLTTGNTRVITIPDASTTLVGHDTTQNISNKTFLSTNTYTANDDAFFLQDNSDNTKLAVFQLSGITTGTTRTFTFPDANTTLVGTAATQTITNKDIDGGTASDSLRITVPKNTTANLAALSRKEGTIVYDTDLDVLKYDDGSNLITLSSTSTATPTAAGIVTSYEPTIQSAVNNVSAANYTVTTTDGYRDILVTNGSSTDYTVTLPAASSNAGRLLTIGKVDSAAGTVFVVPGGADTINGKTGNVFRLVNRYSYVTVQCNGTTWLQVGGRLDGWARAYTGNGHGLVNTNVRRFTNSEGLTGEITYADNANDGGSFTINTSGFYIIECSDRNSGATADVAITKNSTSPNSSTSILAKATGSATFWASCSAAVYLTSGDVIRMCTDTGGTPSTADDVHMSILRVG